MNKKYTVGSMFAGIGGICLAFKNAGFTINWANEIDKNACITYRKNHPDNGLIEKDVHNIQNPFDLGYVDVITAGFPCQAFSLAGYRNGFKDPRGNLFFETARFIESIKPEAFFLENVKNLAGHDKGKTLKIIKDTIVKELGYSFIPFILNSKDFGNTPQTRERIYIVGFKNESHVSYYNLEDADKRKYSNTRTCNFKIPDPIPLTKNITDCIDYNKQDKRFYYSSDHIYYNILKTEMTKKNTVYQWRRVYVRENKNNLCPTLTANMGTGGHNVPLIIDDYGIRKLTPKECLNFQGFPDNFNFPENMAISHCYKQAGNSVVVPVVERIAENIKKVLDIK
jgi:DNA (cytosine-5)-methyltransferase 1